jgi:hypothetical protein
VFVAQENIVCFLNWPSLIAKKWKKSSIYKEISLVGLTTGPKFFHLLKQVLFNLIIYSLIDSCLAFHFNENASACHFLAIADESLTMFDKNSLGTKIFVNRKFQHCNKALSFELFK